MPDDLSPLRTKVFSEAIAKLEELLSQGRPVFLMGAGCSKCAGLPLTSELTKQVLENDSLDQISKEILTAVRDSFSGSENAHIEDFLSELVDLIAIADRRLAREAKNAEVELGGKQYSASQLRHAADDIKRAISVVVGKKLQIETHRSFITAVHRPVRPGKATVGQIVDYLVLNYDTAIEDALALEKIPYSDGINGGETGWWDPTTFDRDDLAARIFKIHGSINWIEMLDDPLPRRVSSNVEETGTNGRRILIWPASTKYRETQRDPYAQLAERARHAMRPKTGSQRVLLICGYSFEDTHINTEVERAIRESGGDLTVAAFTGKPMPEGQLKEWIENPEIKDQVLIYAKRGFFHGDYSEKAKVDLVWWKFENLVRLLRGER